MNKPNVIFILTDDQGYWSLGAYGNKEISTPNIDRLGKEGIIFDNFFCASPVCSPARASILTGKIPSQHGVMDWIKGGNLKEGGINYLDGLIAYTDILASHGYICGLSGKWHLGNSFTPQHGFSHWYVHQKGSGNYFYAPMVRDGKAVEDSGYITDLITDDAISFIEAQGKGGSPFYLSINYTAPHSPWSHDQHPRKYLDMYGDCKFECARQESPHPDATYVYGETDARNSLIGYYASISAVDDNVGRIMETLRTAGLEEDTLVIFSSDNGFNCGHHGIWGKGNGTFSLNMYDTSIKVPMIFHHKGQLDSGVRIDELLSHYDLFQTILEYCGITDYNDKSLPGSSFYPLLRGERYTGRGSVVIYDEYGPVRMIRTKEYKYVHRYPFGPHEFYDLKKDPDERHNLYMDEEYKELIESLRGDLTVWFAKYVDSRIDGTREPVRGNGQLLRPGVFSEGKIAFDQNRVKNTDPRIDPGTTKAEQEKRVR